MQIQHTVHAPLVQLDLIIENEITPAEFPKKLAVLPKITIHNYSRSTLERAYLRFICEPMAVLSHCCCLPTLHQGEHFSLNDIELPVNPEVLGRQCRDLAIQLRIELLHIQNNYPLDVNGIAQSETFAVQTEEIMIRQRWGRSVSDFFSSRDHRNGLPSHPLQPEKPEGFEDALHQKNYCGVSAKEIIDTWRATAAFENIISFGGTMQSRDEKFFRRQRSAVEQLILAGKKTGHPHMHPLNRVKQAEQALSEYWQTDFLANAISSLVPQLHQKLNSMRKVGASLAEILDLPLKKREDWRKLYELSCIDAKAATILPALTDTNDLSAVKMLLLQLEHNVKPASLIREELLQRWKMSFLELNPDELRRLSGSPLRSIRLGRLCHIHGHCRKAGEYFENDLHLLTDYLCITDRIKELTAELPQKLQTISQSMAIQDLLSAVDSAEQIHRKLQQITDDAALPKKLADQDAQAKAAAFRRIAEDFQIKREQLNDLLQLEIFTGEDFIGAEYQLYQNLLDNREKLSTWLHWNTVCQEACRCGLHELARRYLNGLDHEAVLPAYLHALSNDLLICIGQNPLFSAFLPELLYG